MKGLTEGRIVHYVLQEGPNAGKHRPAIVTEVKDPKAEVVLHWCNLTVFGIPGDFDQTGLSGIYRPGNTFNVVATDWESPIHLPGTWHWPEQVD